MNQKIFNIKILNIKTMMILNKILNLIKIVSKINYKNLKL